MKFRALFAALPLFLVTACGGGGDGGNAAAPTRRRRVKPPAGTNWVETVVKTPEGGYPHGQPERADQDGRIRIAHVPGRAARSTDDGLEPLKRIMSRPAR